MKSMPAASAMRASARQSGQLADQRSGTFVAVRLDEQFAPNMPIFSTLPLYMAMRSGSDAVRADNVSSNAVIEIRLCRHASQCRTDLATLPPRSAPSLVADSAMGRA